MMKPSSLDTLVYLDGEVLGAVVDLIRSARPVSQWPETARQALAAALDPREAGPIEAAKAVRLRRHLFVDMPAPSLAAGEPSAERWGDRLRADLPDLVDFGAGLHLVDYEKVLDTWEMKAS